MLRCTFAIGLQTYIEVQKVNHFGFFESMHCPNTQTHTHTYILIHTNIDQLKLSRTRFLRWKYPYCTVYCVHIIITWLMCMNLNEIFIIDIVRFFISILFFPFIFLLVATIAVTFVFAFAFVFAIASTPLAVALFFAHTLSFRSQTRVENYREACHHLFVTSVFWGMTQSCELMFVTHF